jgi:hypothetical protein
VSVNAKVCIDTISGERWQAITLPSPNNGKLPYLVYKSVVKALTQKSVEDLVKLYGTRIVDEPYITIRSAGDVWERDDEIEL